MSETPIILPNSHNHETDRSRERSSENQRYLPVIIKRTDESKRHPDDILERAIHEGLQQLTRPILSLYLSAIAAGLILGFSAMAVAIMTAVVPPDAPDLVQRIMVALVYPLGFIVCIMSGTQLFTEHTATAVYPVLDRRQQVPRLLKLWLTVIAGNLCGTLASSFLISSADIVIGARAGYLEVADHMMRYSTWDLLLSAILAGWLMAQGAWLVLATPPQSSQILCIYLVTFLIGIGGLHHSIAGSAEVFTAMFMGMDITIGACIGFLITALCGNLIGGSLFVAILNYGHIRHTQAKRS